MGMENALCDSWPLCCTYILYVHYATIFVVGTFVGLAIWLDEIGYAAVEIYIIRKNISSY